MREYEVIRRLAEVLPRSPRQRNAPFTCDAELLPFGEELWALTLDDCSPEEDRFDAADPERLGTNLAVATLSDLLAVGAEPAWLLHSLTLPATADAAFVDGLARGISAVLAQAGCACCGGDLSAGPDWRYCGFAMGRVPGQRPLTRVLPAAPHTLWVSGPLGDANVAALAGLPCPRFELRLETAALLRAHAAAAIDTSSGLADALWCLHAVSPGIRLEIELSRIPLAPTVPAITTAAGLPPAAALLGGAGEYELLFAVPAEAGAEVSRAFQAAGAVPIGNAAPAAEPGIAFTDGGTICRLLAAPPPDPRNFADLPAYIASVAALAKELFDGLPFRCYGESA